MTTYNKSTLKTFFQTSDIPDGSDYANFIDSYVNIVDTAAQTMAGSLYTTELDTAVVSAGSVNITGALTGTTASLTAVSATSLNLSGNVSAVAGSVYTSAVRIQSVAIISAAGTAQATGAVLTATINRLQGITDGQTTGFVIPANQTGLVQYIVNETAVSGNLWPPTGGQINGKTANTVFALAANTSYVIFHTAASAYGVK